MTRFLSAIALLASLPALATPINETLSLADGGQVSIENICGEITVAGVEREGVIVRGELEEGAELHTGSSGNRATIHVKGEKSFKGWMESSCADLRIELPIHTQLNIDAVSADIQIGSVHQKMSIESISGNIMIGVGPTSLDIESVSGDITLKGVSEELDIETVSGDIHVDSAPSRVDIENVSGDIELAGGDFLRVEIESVSGDFDLLGSLQKNAEIDLTTHSGEVTMLLPNGAHGDFQLESFSGNLELMNVSGKSQGMGPGTTLRHTLGEGGPAVSITTFSGDIEIEER